MDSSMMLKVGAAALGAAAIGFFVGKKVALKGPTGFGERVTKASKAVTPITAAEAKAYIAAAHPIIIDVRDSADVSSGIKGAINIPLSNLVFMADQDFALPDDVKVKGEVKVPKGTKFVHPKLANVKKSQPILVSCGLGGQALIGAEILADYGFTSVEVVAGGNMGWMDNGGEVCECMK